MVKYKLLFIKHAIWFINHFLYYIFFSKTEISDEDVTFNTEKVLPFFYEFDENGNKVTIRKEL